MNINHSIVFGIVSTSIDGGLMKDCFDLIKIDIDIGVANVANIVISKRKCHFGATYFDGMTGYTLFYLRYSKGT